MYYIKRAFALLVMGGFIGLTYASFEYENYVLTGVFAVLTAITFFVYRGIKKKKLRKEQRAAAAAQSVQNPPRLKLSDQLFLAAVQEILTSDPSPAVPTYQDYSVPNTTYNNNYEANRRREQEEQDRQQREEYQRMADQSRREYERLKYNDPQCRDERTQVAEYNMNYFARKAKGKW